MAYITKEHFNYELEELKVSQVIPFKKYFEDLHLLTMTNSTELQNSFLVSLKTASRYTNTELPLFSIKFKTSFKIFI